MRLKIISSCVLPIGFIVLGDIQFTKLPSWGIGMSPGLAQAEGETMVGEAMQLYELGDRQVSEGKLHEALETFDRALRRAREEGDRVLEAVILNDIGVVYRNLGDYSQGL
ncbi:tetratricopeptide repeat protein [Phormidium sp. CCY1219]|uniref:tetratricopeptide repeat protein n=1 Tax=Phormidium sp. CCY1219 TaxID=2886104 RepID=UPI002D1F071F|nr:tetratricopeptide repeat protein [Phormidium sp. CCY1219]MEB3828088.1 tetratricopeptide repeat protein [Phormidium sp. CCY1219]